MRVFWLSLISNIANNSELSCPGEISRLYRPSYWWGRMFYTFNAHWMAWGFGLPSTGMFRELEVVSMGRYRNDSCTTSLNKNDNFTGYWNVYCKYMTASRHYQCALEWAMPFVFLFPDSTKLLIEQILNIYKLDPTSFTLYGGISTPYQSLIFVWKIHALICNHIAHGQWVNVNCAAMDAPMSLNTIGLYQ